MGRLRDEDRLLQARTEPDFLHGAQILEVLEAGVLVTDAGGIVTLCNAAAGRLIGANPSAVIGQQLPLEELEDNEPLTSALATGEPQQRILMRSRRRLKTAWIELSVHPLPPAAGQRTGGLVCSLLDVTDRYQAERELREERDRAERFLSMAASVIVALDTRFRITMINRAGLQLLGCEEHELIGKDWIETAVPADARDEDRRLLRSMLRGTHPGEIDAESAEAPLQTKSGEVRTIEWRTAVLRAADGSATGLLCSGTDVTERLRHAEAVAHLAYHDQLTGLPNRALLEEHLEIALARGAREEREVALLFLDLDNFKLVNDSMGHQAGDRLLQLVAERLSSITRASDLLARHGGDELLLLLTDVDGGTTVEVAASVAEKILEALSAPFTIGGTRFEISASIGVAVFPHDGSTPAELLRTADATMYQAKAAGRNRVAVHRPELG